MKLDCILTAVNKNKTYRDFIPFFIKTWNKLYPNVDVKIIFIIDNIPEDLKIYQNNFIHIPPSRFCLTEEAIPFICVYIRYLYPAIMNYKNGVMITDIDMIPTNRIYYTEYIKPYKNDKYIITRDSCDGYQFESCYNVAVPKIWSDVWNIKTFDDIIERLKFVWESDLHNMPQKFRNKGRFKGWYKDQIDAYNRINEWNKKTNNFLVLKDTDTKFKRLCRSKRKELFHPDVLKRVKEGYYVDYHCLKPFKKHREKNMSIYEAL